MKKVKKAFLTIGLAALCLLAVVALERSGSFDRLEWMTFDARMRIARAEKHTNDQIVLLMIDEASLQALNPLVGRWPWPRVVFADLLEFISLGKPKAVLFDILFTENERCGAEVSPELTSGDERFMAATGMTGTTYHAAQMLKDTPDDFNKTLLGRPLPTNFVDSFSLEVEGLQAPATRKFSRTADNYYLPLEGLYLAARGVGTVDFAPDPDGVFRRTKLLTDYGGSIFPSLGLAPYLAGVKKIKAAPGALELDALRVPLDSEGCYAVNLHGRYELLSVSGVLASAQKVMAGEVEKLIIHPSEFEDKIVIIGSSAVGVESLKPTAISSTTPGPLLHASILSNLIEGDFLQDAPPWFGLVASLLLSLAGGFAVLYSTKTWFQAGAPLSMGLTYSICTVSAFNSNLVLPVTSPLAALFFSSLTAVIYYNSTEGRARRKMRRTFSLYVAPEMLDRMMENPEEQESLALGTEETLSVLFSDIRGFTDLSEKLPATRVVELLNIYFSEMVDSIFRHKGTIDKFIGDAIMSFYGAPVHMPDHAKKAVLSALDMIERLKRVNNTLAARGFAPLEIGIGINTGNVVLGNIGSEKKLNYTVIGDSVNLAARIEGLCKQYSTEVLISEFTHEQLDGEIPCSIVDVVAVKGKKEPVRIFRARCLPASEGVEEARREAAEINRGFELYMERRWEEAVQVFSAIEDDPVAQLYVARCTLFKSDPPPADWEGIVVLKTK